MLHYCFVWARAERREERRTERRRVIPNTSMTFYSLVTILVRNLSLNSCSHTQTQPLVKNTATFYDESQMSFNTIHKDTRWGFELHHVKPYVFKPGSNSQSHVLPIAPLEVGLSEILNCCFKMESTRINVPNLIRNFDYYLRGFYMLPQWLCGFSLGCLVSSHPPNSSMLFSEIAKKNCLQVWIKVLICVHGVLLYIQDAFLSHAWCSQDRLWIPIDSE